MPAAVPEEVAGIQVNSCEKPGCTNFGVPPSAILTGPPKADRPQGPGIYGIRRSGRSEALLWCERCNSSVPIKSNKAVREEMERLSAYLKPKDDPARHAPDCSRGAARFFEEPGAFRYNGTTPSGKTERYECRTCRKTFTVSPSPILRQKTSHINKWFFKLLVNKVPFQRICEMLEIDMPTLHRKIDFLHRQCMAFAGDRERRLLDGVYLVNGKRKPGTIYVAVDRQEYSVDWKGGGGPVERLNIILDAIGSADIRSGYVFGMHLNFDPGMDTGDVINDLARRNGDLEKLPGYRDFARVWLETDYRERLEAPQGGNDDGAKRPRGAPAARRLPDHGMPVHEEYTMYAHLFLLKRMFSGIDKIRFFMDCETSIRAACHAAFSDEIREGRFEGFFINNHKSMTESQRRRAYNAAVSNYRKFLEEHPGVSPRDTCLLMLRGAMESMVVKGYHRDKCLLHPFPDPDEPGKEVCYFNDTGRYDISEEGRNHLAWLYGKASLRAIDHFFTQLRQRVSLFAPPPSPAGSTRRTRVEHSPYSPAMIQKVTDIFRVFYNYVEPAPPPYSRKRPCSAKVDADRPIGVDLRVPTGEEDPEWDRLPEAAEGREAEGKKGGKAGATPAMRFGLAKAPVRYEDILYFRS